MLASKISVAVKLPRTSMAALPAVPSTLSSAVTHRVATLQSAPPVVMDPDCAIMNCATASDGTSMSPIIAALSRRMSWAIMVNIAKSFLCLRAEDFARRVHGRRFAVAPHHPDRRRRDDRITRSTKRFRGAAFADAREDTIADDPSGACTELDVARGRLAFRIPRHVHRPEHARIHNEVLDPIRRHEDVGVIVRVGID